MPPLRVLHVSPYGPEAWAYGGIPRVVGALTRGLAERGVEVTLATTDARDAAARLPTAPSRAAGVERRVFPNVSNRLAYRRQFFTPRGLSAWLKRHAADFDLGHLHGCHHLPGALAARALVRAGKPYVLQPNGTAPRIERRRWAKALFDRTLGRGVLERAARVVAVSGAEAASLAAMGVAGERLSTIPNPIDAAEFRTSPQRGLFRRRVGIESEPLVVFLGRITPRKRVDLLVEAFARLDCPGALLVVAGHDGGALEAARRCAARTGVASRVGFPGLLTGSERLAALADADVVVYPSHDEVFGLVAAEAILCGTPVVVADDSGCGELVRAVGGGRTARSGDLDDLVRRMRQALLDGDAIRAELPLARSRLLRDYSADSVALRTLELYASLAGER
jgi:glycosyltransferase involved in cell wall biosynthesis